MVTFLSVVQPTLLYESSLTPPTHLHTDDDRSVRVDETAKSEFKALYKQHGCRGNNLPQETVKPPILPIVLGGSELGEAGDWHPPSSVCK